MTTPGKVVKVVEENKMEEVGEVVMVAVGEDGCFVGDVLIGVVDSEVVGDGV